jgi:uncharacterized protein YndB with AHSA1/START domain
MPADKQIIEFVQIVKATPSQVYLAFTNATSLKEWFCDVATLDPKPGGRYYAAWNNGFYACGEFTAVEPDKKIQFSWYGRHTPDLTQVEIELEEIDEGTRVKLIHRDIGADEGWADTSQQIERGWDNLLDNLSSVLETGQDLRFVQRPMLGIEPDELTVEIAQQLEVPVNQGVYLVGIVEGMGAQAAGLQKNDVIVKIAGEAVTDFPTLTTALQHHRAGEQVDVVFYRGPERKTVQMRLSGRPIPEIPFDVSELAEMVKDRNNTLANEMDAFFSGVTEEQASYKPAPLEWSAKEVLVHLIHGERDNQIHISNLVGGQEQWADGYSGNQQARIDATLSVYPGIHDLLAELKRNYAETSALFAHLPADFPIKRKGSYWRAAYYWLVAPNHEHDHIDQMQTAIKASGST